MIDVGVRQKNHVDRCGVEAQVAVPPPGVGFTPLVHAAIQKDAQPLFAFDEMFGARHGARCAFECYFHYRWIGGISACKVKEYIRAWAIFGSPSKCDL